MQVHFLAELPLDPEVRVGGDSGKPVVRRKSVGESFLDLVRNTVHKASDDQPLVIPAEAVLVAGSRAITRGPGKEWGISVYTPVIVKYRDSRTEEKIQLEDLLR